jgi:hypothetical protein
MRRRVLWLFALSACTPDLEPVPPSAVDLAQRARAAEFAESVLSAWGRGEYPDVGAWLTPEMQRGFTPAKQKEYADWSLSHLGKFMALAFVEVQRSRPAEHVVYRFKGRFTAKTWEVRVVFDLDGRISGFWTKPWRDELE